MKLCISSCGNNLESSIDPRFGRSQMFIFVDSETMEYEVVKNPAMNAGGGAGTQAAQLVVNNGAEAVLTGNVGPNANSVLNAANIKVYVGLAGTCRDAIAKFKKDEIQAVNKPSVARHAGMGL